jgi:hypothetical protein
MECEYICHIRYIIDFTIHHIVYTKLKCYVGKLHTKTQTCLPACNTDAYTTDGSKI